MFRRRRVRHSYPQPIVDLVVRLVPAHGALALSRMLDIPKSVIYRWRATHAGTVAPDANGDETDMLAALLARCEEFGFPLTRYVLETRSSAPQRDGAAPAAALDRHDGRAHAAQPESTRMPAPRRPVDGDRGAEATRSPHTAHAGRAHRPYVYDARKERPMRGVRNRMEAVRETLDTRYFLDVDCRSLAESAGMSHYHFIRVFRAMYGTSPHQYLTRTRVEAAKRLLLGSTEPIEVIAVGVGFRSGPSMSRAFKRIEGASASRYFQATHRFAADADAPAAAPESH